MWCKLPGGFLCVHIDVCSWWLCSWGCMRWINEQSRRVWSLWQQRTAPVRIMDLRDGTVVLHSDAAVKRWRRGRAVVSHHLCPVGFDRQMLRLTEAAWTEIEAKWEVEAMELCVSQLVSLTDFHWTVVLGAWLLWLLSKQNSPTSHTLGLN